MSHEHIRLLATDLDGTLLNPFGQVSKGNHEAIKRAQSNGIITVAATARSIRSTHQISVANNLGPIAICQNGASIYLIEDKKLIFHDPIGLPEAHTIITKMKTEIPGVIFAIELLERFIPENDFFVTPIPGLTSEPVKDIFESLTSPATKIIARHPNLAHKELKEAAIRLCSHCADITSAGADWVDFQSIGTSKASGLKRAAQILKINRSQTAAIGDQVNDIEMLKWVSYSAAPANAHIEAKRAASWETSSNLEDGVASFINHLIELNPNPSQQ